MQDENPYSNKRSPEAPAGAERWSVSSLGLRKKFLLGLGFILLWFCFISAFLVYQQEKSLLEDTAYAKSEIVMAAVEAEQSYVREVLRPKMFETLGDDAFVLEAMSTSFVGRAMMDYFNMALPEYQYRRVAIDARNPASEANSVELQMIRYFTESPEETNWQGIMKVAGRSYFMRFRPVYFDKSCMHCHGDAADAPPALVGLYGRERGFGRKEGGMAGVVTVGIPVDVALAQIKDKAASVFVAGLTFGVVLFVLISLVFNRLVLHNLRGLLDIFREGLRGEEQARFFHEVEAKDEIGELTIAARMMAAHLRDSRRQLERNAEELELKVDERTTALRESELLLRQKVVTRSRELQALNALAELTTKAVGLGEILPEALRHTLKLIPARGAGLYLLSANPPALVLQCHEAAAHLDRSVAFQSHGCQLLPAESAPDLPSSLREAGCGHMSLLDDPEMGLCLNIPLCCRGKVLGVLSFIGVGFTEISSELHELLFSIGRQIGIAIESLQNLEKLLQSKELLQSVFDGITDVVVLLDREFRVKMVNKAYLMRYGLSVDEALGQRCYELHSGGSSPCDRCSLEKAFQSRAPMTEEVQSGGGETFSVYFYPILDERGEVESIVRYARDITDQKRVEQQIQKAEKLASLGQLAAGVAHEINNPLGVILCHTDLLKRQVEALPQAMSDVGTIEKHALSCKRTVSDLLKFARGQATVRQPTSLNRSIEEVVEMVGYQFRLKQTRIELNTDPSLPLLNIDADKMKQVYLNLLMNSLQAINGDGIVRIATRYLAESGRAQMTFWDNGHGIPPSLIGRVFDPFFTTKAAGEGTGLGLSVTYGIIRDHGGEIQVESEPGQWTRFSIVLPVNDTAC